MVPQNDGLQGRRLSEKGVKPISRDGVGTRPMGEALGAKTVCLTKKTRPLPVFCFYDLSMDMQRPLKNTCSPLIRPSRSLSGK